MPLDNLLKKLADNLTITYDNAPARKPREQVPLPSFNDERKDKLVCLVSYATVEELKDILYQDSLQISGNKSELITRFLQSTDFQPWLTLSKFSYAALTTMADREGVKLYRSKKDQLEEILFTLFDIPRPEKTKEVETISKTPALAFEDKAKQTLFTIASSASNDELKSVLDGLEEKVSGNKNELIFRLLEAVQYNPKEVLMLLSMDSLSSYASHNGYPKARSKKILITSILSEEFGILKEEEPDSKPKKSFDDPSKDLLYEILTMEMPISSVNRGLRILALKMSGSKQEKVERLLNATAFDPRQTLSLMDNFDLLAYADSIDIPRRRSKDDQVDEIMSAQFTRKKQKMSEIPIQENGRIESVPESTVEKGHPAEAVGRSSFEKLVSEIERWVPQIRFQTEEGFRGDLGGYLAALGHKTRYEEGDCLVDILVDDKYPIEMKKTPRKPEYNRTIGQIMDYGKKYGCALVVICDIKSSDAFEDFKMDVREHFGSKYNVVVMRK
jgi:hypothetical protein